MRVSDDCFWGLGWKYALVRSWHKIQIRHHAVCMSPDVMCCSARVPEMCYVSRRPQSMQPTSGSQKRSQDLGQAIAVEEPLTGISHWSSIVLQRHAMKTQRSSRSTQNLQKNQCYVAQYHEIASEVSSQSHAVFRLAECEPQVGQSFDNKA